MSNGTFAEIIVLANPPAVLTSHLYVDPKRTDTYTATGSREFPFKTLQAAYTAAALISSSTNPIFIVIISENTNDYNRICDI